LQAELFQKCCEAKQVSFRLIGFPLSFTSLKYLIVKAILDKRVLSQQQIQSAGFARSIVTGADARVLPKPRVWNECTPTGNLTVTEIRKASAENAMQIPRRGLGLFGRKR